MKYIENFEVKDIVDEDTDDDIKRLIFDFNINKAERKGAHIDEVVEEMKRKFINYLEDA